MENEMNYKNPEEISDEKMEDVTGGYIYTQAQGSNIGIGNNNSVGKVISENCGIGWTCESNITQTETNNLMLSRFPVFRFFQNIFRRK